MINLYINLRKLTHVEKIAFIIYIIDKKGLVRYSKIGLSENMYNELDEVLSDLLKK
jgi:putative aminopeptidase FrvX